MGQWKLENNVKGCVKILLKIEQKVGLGVCVYVFVHKR